MDNNTKNRIIELIMEQINQAREYVRNNKFPGHFTWTVISSCLINEKLITQSEGWTIQTDISKLAKAIFKKEGVRVSKDNLFLKV